MSAAEADRKPTWRLREVAPGSRGDLKTVGRLHMELLGFGPMAALGEPFIREICYGVQLADGLLRIALGEIDGRPAGFVAYTSKSITFHRAALRNHWFYAGWVVALAILANPRILIRLVRAVRVVVSRRGETRLGEDPMGEVVCIAAKPEFLAGRFARLSGIRVSDELTKHAARQLRAEGVREMRMIVDADNKKVLLLYHSLGAQFEKYEQAGEPKVHVWFDLTRFPEDAQSGEAPANHDRAHAD